MGLIRLFLALVVVADHVNIFVFGSTGLHINGYLKLGVSGPSAVMLFYVISGFLISYALSRKYPPGISGTLTFYRSRFVRIFSLYWPLFAIMVIANFSGARSIAGSSATLACGFGLIGTDWLLAFAAYPAPYWGCLPAALAPAWTLGAELTFYMLAPFLLRSERSALAALLASVVLRAILLATIGESNTWTYFFLPSTICFFLLGHHARVLTDRWYVPAWLSWCLLALACWFSLPSAMQASWQTWHFHAALICFAAALPGVFRATRCSRLLIWIGDLSFPLYLIHMSVIHLLFDPSSSIRWIGMAIIRRGQTFVDPVDGGEMVAGVVMLTSVGAAVAVHYLIERPFGGILAACLTARPVREARFMKMQAALIDLAAVPAPVPMIDPLSVPRVGLVPPAPQALPRPPADDR